MNSDSYADDQGDVVLTLDVEASDLMKKILDEYNAVPEANMTAGKMASHAVRLFYGVWTDKLTIAPGGKAAGTPVSN